MLFNLRWARLLTLWLGLGGSVHATDDFFHGAEGKNTNIGKQ